MGYEIKVSHIRENYTITDKHSEVWTRTIEDVEELKLVLNRVAIATTQYAVVEFPELEIKCESRRVQVRVISGKLYYTEVGSSHRKDLVVIPEEIIRLLEGQSVEQALHRDSEEDVYIRPTRGSGYGTKKFKNVFLLICSVVFLITLVYSWISLTQQARLIEPPRFVPTLDHQGELLRKYADVYVSELREGATVLELTDSGEFSLYELWYAPARKKYILMQVEAHSVSAGLFRGEPALLGGAVHLIELQNDSISLHGIAYKRYGKALSELGEVLEGNIRGERSSER